MSQPRVATIEGARTVIVDRPPVLPQKLDQLLSSLTHVTRRENIRPTGASAQCDVWRTHRFAVLREGRHLGSDAVLRDLRITMCQDCGAVCVRDISVDTLPGLTPGRGGPRRRDQIIGWYSGARRGQRVYR